MVECPLGLNRLMVRREDRGEMRTYKRTEEGRETNMIAWMEKLTRGGRRNEKGREQLSSLGRGDGETHTQKKPEANKHKHRRALKIDAFI